MKQTIKFSLGIGAIIFIYLGTRFPLLDVPLAGELSFNEASWGGETRLAVILGLLAVSVVSLFGRNIQRFEKIPVLFGAAALGFLGNICLSASLWRTEHLANLAQFGAQSIDSGIKLRSGASCFGFGVVLCISYCLFLIFSRNQVTHGQEKRPEHL